MTKLKLKEFNKDDMTTWPYLDYKDWLKIIQNNGENLNELTFRLFEQYAKFCFEHSFISYGQFSRYSFKELYSMYKENQWNK